MTCYIHALTVVFQAKPSERNVPVICIVKYLMGLQRIVFSCCQPREAARRARVRRRPRRPGPARDVDGSEGFLRAGVFPVDGGRPRGSLLRTSVRPPVSGKNVCVDVFSGHFRDWQRERCDLSYEDASYEDDPISKESPTLGEVENGTKYQRLVFFHVLA